MFVNPGFVANKMGNNNTFPQLKYEARILVNLAKVGCVSEA